MTDAPPLAHSPTPPARGPSLETMGMTKTFGRFTALDNVSIQAPAGTFHALLGENGAGKSTLVKCVMGFYTPDKGTLLLDGTEVDVKNPRDAQALGVGMVYQHFTLVPSLTAAENLVASRADAPAVINWRKERDRLETFLSRMPFRVPLDRPVSSLAAGEKQKLEILKLLYLDQRFLILDEPTSVLTPGEADEILGLLKDMAHRGEITALMITHKFREVEAFCDDVSVLRRGAKVGGGKVGELSTREMAAMMIGDAVVRPSAARVQAPKRDKVLEIAGLFVENDEGRDAVAGFDLQVRAGEIVGIAGVSGNGQSQLVEALSGQRPIKLGQVLVHDQDFEPKRGPLRQIQGVRAAGGAAEKRDRAGDVGRREHGVSILRQAADRLVQMVAVAGADADAGARAHRQIQCEDGLARRADPRPFRRQRAAGGAGARTLQRRRRADRRQSLFRPRLRLRRRHQGADHGAAQSRRGGAAGFRGSRRDPRIVRPRRGDLRGQGRLSDRGRGRRPHHHRALYGGTLMKRGSGNPFADRRLDGAARLRLDMRLRDSSPF